MSLIRVDFCPISSRLIDSWSLQIRERSITPDFSVIVIKTRLTLSSAFQRGVSQLLTSVRMATINVGKVNFQLFYFFFILRGFLSTFFKSIFNICLGHLKLKQSISFLFQRKLGIVLHIWSRDHKAAFAKLRIIESHLCHVSYIFSIRKMNHSSLEACYSMAII